jgi:ribosomal protein L32
MMKNQSSLMRKGQRQSHDAQLKLEQAHRKQRSSQNAFEPK